VYGLLIPGLVILIALTVPIGLALWDRYVRITWADVGIFLLLAFIRYALWAQRQFGPR
jgi:hypothetical protein